MILSLPELFAGDRHFTARRESWADGKLICGVPSRMIKNQYLDGTLFLDERMKHYAKGKDVRIGAWVCLFELEGDNYVIRPYIPSYEEELAVDWLVEDYTEMILEKVKKEKGE